MHSSSDYYLERVGFEANVRLRLNLKNGQNTIGRTESKVKNDFAIESGRCSALHCIIFVSGDSVEIVNKSVSLSFLFICGNIIKLDLFYSNPLALPSMVSK